MSNKEYRISKGKIRKSETQNPKSETKSNYRNANDRNGVAEGSQQNPVAGFDSYVVLRISYCVRQSLWVKWLGKFSLTGIAGLGIVWVGKAYLTEH